MKKLGISRNGKVDLIKSSIGKWHFIKESKPNHPLMFVHIPKCGGTYCKTLFRELDILSVDKFESDLGIQGDDGVGRPHQLAKKSYSDNFIIFGVIRHPVDRFESLLNFTLGGGGPPKRKFIINDYIKKMGKNGTINDFVDMQTDEELLSYTPYRTLKYYSQNVDIFIKIDELENFLSFFGYKNIPKTDRKNASKRNYGYLSEKNKARIARLFKDDIAFYNKKTNTN